MPAPKQITREKVEERIPFCYGIIQRIADDLQVSRTAVSKFLNLPENDDLRQLVKSEKKRIREYAEMTVLKHLISGDIETAKWFLTAFPSKGLTKKPAPYKPKRNKNYEYILMDEHASLSHIRELAFPLLDFTDAKIPGAVTQFLPYGMKEKLNEILNEKSNEELNDKSGLIQNKSDENFEKQIERNAMLREKNSGKSGHEIYKEFKKRRKE